ncbi:hypothetical protein SAMN05660199_03699 [Klenkia soli]|uniref:Uncharacterized protein n=1 Tax=Klenkia soli TaxID=1052260 RepID=A0A1H0S049_9ACTN|nr:hypothetical protein SAMN05660199_03699 [Klenkia soli]
MTRRRAHTLDRVPDLRTRRAAGDPAGRLAAWATAWLGGRAPYDDALEAVTGDRAHVVGGLPDGAQPLGGVLTSLRGRGERRLRLVLPVPGDVHGLPPLPGLAAAAVEAGQVVVGDTLVLLPESATSEAVLWTAVEVPPGVLAPPPVEGTLRSLSGRLDLAVGDAARTLAALDLARWHPEVPALLAGLAGRAEDPGLPPDTDPVAVSVLTRARRLATVLDLALADAPGAAVTVGQMAAREQALRPLADAVREATTAVWNWLPR